LISVAVVLLLATAVLWMASLSAVERAFFGSLGGSVALIFAVAFPWKRSRRRWFQFSIQTLFTLTAIVGVAIFWFQWWDGVQAEQQAVLAIERLGGMVTYDYFSRDDVLYPHGPNWLKQLLGDHFLAHAVHVRFWDKKQSRSIVDADLRQFAALTRLEELVFDNEYDAYSDAGLMQLNRLGNLKQLTIAGKQVTSAGVASLQTALPKCNITAPRSSK
jgi:hypothetical protein